MIRPLALLACTALLLSTRLATASDLAGDWALELPSGEAGWLVIREGPGGPTASLMWGVGSERPVAGFKAEGNAFSFSRTARRPLAPKTEPAVTTRITGRLDGAELRLTADTPSGQPAAFSGRRMPPLPARPDFGGVTFGEPMVLLARDTLRGWRPTNPAKINGWSVQDGVLRNTTAKTDFSAYGDHANLRTDAEFTDFQLHLEFRLPAERGGNSGIYLRGLYEVQVTHRDSSMQGINGPGAVFGRITPASNQGRPAGEWESYDITLVDRHVTVVHNGVTVIDRQPVAGPTGGALHADVTRPGPLMLQGDHTAVEYRNIVLRPVARSAPRTGAARAPERERMLQLAGWPDDVRDVAWERLPQLASTRVTLYRGVEGTSGFSHHPTLAWHDGRFFAAWSNGDRDEDASGQRVVYATSTDGHTWSAPRLLAAGVEGRSHTPCGFWIRGEAFYALAARRKARDGGAESGDNPLLAWRWDPARQAFAEPEIVARNFFANDAPRLLPDGAWLMLGKPGGKSAGPAVRAARGGVAGLDDWAFTPLPARDVSHDSFWYPLGGDRIAVIEAAGAVPNRYLLRLESADAGRTWLPPVRTNFPDADSRLCGLRLSNGRYVLVNNPNPHRYRVPLSIAVSRDGLTFPALANLRTEQTNKRFPGHAKAPGYQYPRALEHDGRLWVIYSVNKEDIELSVVPLAAIDGALATATEYPVSGYGPERVLTPRDPEFATTGPWRAGEILAAGRAFLSHTPGERPAAPAWAEWKPQVADAGIYDLYLRWPAAGSAPGPQAEIVPIEIRHRGTLAASSVDQSRYGDTWIHLGDRALAAGESLQVRLTASARGVTAADALKLVRRPDAPRRPGPG